MADNVKMSRTKVNLKTFNHISVFLHSNFGRKCSFHQPVVLNRTMIVRLFKSIIIMDIHNSFMDIHNSF